MNENMETNVMDEAAQLNVDGATKVPFGAKIVLGVTVIGGAAYLLYQAAKKGVNAIKAKKAAKKDECVEVEEYVDVTEGSEENAQ